MTVAEAEAARRPPVAPTPIEPAPIESAPIEPGTIEATPIEVGPVKAVPVVESQRAGRAVDVSSEKVVQAYSPPVPVSSPAPLPTVPPAVLPAVLLPAAQNVLPGAPPVARPAPVDPLGPSAETPVAPTDSFELLDWFEDHPAVPAPLAAPTYAMNDEPPAAPALSEHPPVAAFDAALIPVQPTRSGPRVELGFRDGSSAELDPAGEQAQALEELARTLTGF